MNHNRMMRSPLIKFICCLLGVAAAGVPLVVFTNRSPQAAKPAQADLSEQGIIEVPALVRYSARPTEISIRHEGRLLCKFTPAAAGGSWQGKFQLPPLAVQSSLELEVEAAWLDAHSPAQAITIELTPPGLPSAKDTQWTDEGMEVLHDVFIFQW